MGSANEKRRHNVTLYLIGQAHTQNDSWTTDDYNTRTWHDWGANEIIPCMALEAESCNDANFFVAGGIRVVVMTTSGTTGEGKAGITSIEQWACGPECRLNWSVDTV